MSVCMHCHTMDKNFFAPICHACNNETGFLMQCAFSLMWTVVTVTVAITGVYWFWQGLVYVANS